MNAPDLASFAESVPTFCVVDALPHLLYRPAASSVKVCACPPSQSGSDTSRARALRTFLVQSDTLSRKVQNLPRERSLGRTQYRK